MSPWSDVKSSGKEFSKHATGSQRDNREGKGRYDLISPLTMKRLAVHMENGARKYGPNNWMLGQPLSWYWDSAARHWDAVKAGETDEDHEAAALWNIHCYMHTKMMIESGQLPAELDDMPIPLDGDDYFDRLTERVGDNKPLD